MGQSYTNLVGVPPVVTSLSWRSWYLRLLGSRLAECPLSRLTTYYFSTSGNDSTGDGSQSLPWATIGKANTILQASSGNIALLFKRGDVWKETATYILPVSGAAPATGQPVIVVSTAALASLPVGGATVTLTGGTTESKVISSFVQSTTTTTITLTTNIANAGHTGVQFTGPSGITVTVPNVTIGAWGSAGLRKPNFSAFTRSYAAAGLGTAATRVDAFTRTYSIAETNTVGAVREVNDSLVYRKLSTIADVDATPGSWARVSNVLYLHAYDDVDLAGSGRTFEGAVVNNCIGVYVNDVDGTRIDSHLITGYGAGTGSLDPNGARPYGFKGSITGTNACVLSNCEGYYSHNHSMGILSTASGGITTFVRCRAGLDTVGDTPFVTYAPGGGHEVICHECESPGVLIPIGIQGNTAPNAFTSHATPVAISAASTGQPVATLTNPGGGWANLPITAGMSLTLTGGTPETLTVLSVDTSAGTVTFTANIANASHTGFTYAAAPLVGSTQATVQYNGALCVCYGCRCTPGPFQVQGAWGSPQSPPAWTDLTNCRSFDVGEVFQKRTPGTIDQNPQTAALTSASQTGTTVTMTTTPTGAIVPIANQWMTLIGGTSPPEGIKVSSYAAGVITFATTIIGAARTGVIYNPGYSASGQNSGFAPFSVPTYTAHVNCWWEWGLHWLSPNAADATLTNTANFPNGSCVFVNCTILVDWSNVSAPAFARNRALWQATSGGSAAGFYNCRFHLKTAARDTGMLELNAGKATTATLMTVMNSLITGEYAEGGAVAGIGNDATKQINNAYGGLSTKTGIAGYSNDPYEVEVSPAVTFGHPEAGSTLASTHNQLVLGYRLEYDADWQARDLAVPAIGPYELLAPVDGTSVAGVNARVSLGTEAQVSVTIPLTKGLPNPVEQFAGGGLVAYYIYQGVPTTVPQSVATSLTNRGLL